MLKWLFLCFLLLHLCAGDSAAIDSSFGLMIYRQLRTMAFDYFDEKQKENGEYIQILRKSPRTQETVPDHVPFPCNVTGGRSQEVPDSVHKLRPGDIDVIAAMGDSVTAGTGIFGVEPHHVLVDNRGVSATGGGQGTWRQYLTLPNILKEFNPNLIGYALGDSLTYHEESQLNVGENGATSQDMPYMAEVLVKRIKSDPRIDVQKHWKLIAIMIGANNFCSDICWAPSFSSFLEDHKTNMLQVLRSLRDNLPRTFVALIHPPHLKGLVISHFERPSAQCSYVRYFGCSCLHSHYLEKYLPEYYDVMNQWYKLEVEIATYPEFQKDDFVVVSQPVLAKFSSRVLSNGYNDINFFAVDCFHVSQRTTAEYANSLWNNLLEPIGEKTIADFSNYTLFDRFLCPKPERPYLITMQNSHTVEKNF